MVKGFNIGTVFQSNKSDRYIKIVHKNNALGWDDDEEYICTHFLNKKDMDWDNAYMTGMLYTKLEIYKYLRVGHWSLSQSKISWKQKLRVK